ncbi:MAG: lipid A biosynthesis acyltransferase [Acidiferrobacteraceae bacterium]|nr:lipid A biosynthesis acyltransferase [Acidiferrobacteraceae bacterium]
MLALSVSAPVTQGKLKDHHPESPRFRLSFFGPRYWGTWLLAGAIGLCLLLPRPLVLALGRQIGKAFFHRNHKRTRIARINLQWCFPDWDEATREAVLREHLTRYGQAILDLGLMWWAPRRRLDRLCTLSGEAELHALRQAGEKVLLIIPHVVGIDMTGAVLAKVAAGASMMKAPSNPLLHWRLWRGRSRFGARIFMRNQGLRPLVKAIRAGWAGYFMPDEDLGSQQSVFAPFFGITTATLPVVGRMAKMTDAKVIPVFCRLDDSGHYHVTLGSVLADFPNGDALADATMVNAAFEAAIRQAPEQYLWTLRWFRTRPNDEPSPYD